MVRNRSDKRKRVCCSRNQYLTAVPIKTLIQVQITLYSEVVSRGRELNTKTLSLYVPLAKGRILQWRMPGFFYEKRAQNRQKEVYADSLDYAQL